MLQLLALLMFGLALLFMVFSSQVPGFVQMGLAKNATLEAGFEHF